MASAANFTCQLPQQTLFFTPRPVPPKNSSLFSLKQCDTMQWKIDTHNRTFESQRFNLVRPSATNSKDIPLNQPSAADMIKRLYTCVNEKTLKEIEGYISDNCCFEDCSFVSPIQGKKEVMQFYKQLTTGMGQNVKFITEHVCEDDEFTVGVDWHLEWKNRHIPFTRGCSFYECSLFGDNFIIKKARVVIESPIKPGGLVLILLRNVTAIFDEFPTFAEWFLNNLYVIVQFLMKIYTRVLAPILNPILSGYIRFWNFMARMFALALSMLIYISKTYFQ